MKPTLFCSFLILWFINFGKAQDTTIVLNTSMFFPTFQSIGIMDKNGWVFKEGSDTSWAKKELDTQDWLKFNPTELSVKNADEDGRVEGWFRLKFSLDSSFQNIPLGVFADRFAAKDVFIDGVHVASFGSTGLNGDPYQEFLNTIDPPVNIDLQLDTEYVLAIYMVDYRSKINPSHLKTTEVSIYGFVTAIYFSGPNFHHNWINFLKNQEMYWMVWSSVCGILSILFWFLYFQNRNEKNLLYIALSTTVLSLMFYTAKINYVVGISHGTHMIYEYSRNFLIHLELALIIITLAKIFKRKVGSDLAIYCLFLIFAGVTDIYFFEGRFGVFISGSALLVCIYLIISSWKQLKGAQWAVVVGILSTIIFLVLFVFNLAKYGTWPFPFINFYISGVGLSLPISLMVYVAMRFKEILNEVRTNADEVIKITEEKRELLVDQNVLLEKKVEERTYELKASQAQLIQSEKMASLGELTAGIAHEIQNPLNFVNNFSEVSSEMIEELDEELAKGDLEEVKVISNYLKGNLEKITHHGKRADAIVKGMLQHSRTSSGERISTDINALCDEYLRLSYHGLRAKESTFNASMKTHFDPELPKVQVITQDIGRVLLNLINNAFQAVHEKSKLNIEGFTPTVTVSTQQKKESVEIKVQDNGSGVPDDIKDKIFQPFFTTKPTGEGTGLGLSLSYDIVNAHGGLLKVKSEAQKGSSFIIQLPK